MLHSAGFRWQRVLGSPFQSSTKMLGWIESDPKHKLLLLYVIIYHYILLYIIIYDSSEGWHLPGWISTAHKLPRQKAFHSGSASFSFTPQCQKTGLMLLIPSSFMEAATGSQFTARNNPSREAEHWLMRQLIKEKAASSGPITACLEEEEKLIKHRTAARFKTTSYLHQGMSSWCPGA